MAIATLALAFFVPLMMEIRVADTVSPAAEELSSLVLYLHSKFWLPSLLYLAAVALHSVWISHRIAGPLYRLRVVLDGVRLGTLPKDWRTRKGDFFGQEIL